MRTELAAGQETGPVDRCAWHAHARPGWAWQRNGLPVRSTESSRLVPVDRAVDRG